jgi:Bacterial Ig-like domain (group 3)/FG-GAP-like repeat
MLRSSIPRKLLIFSLVLFSIAADAQRPRWSSHTYGLTAFPNQVVVADVNGDGISDLVIALPFSSSPSFSPEVAVLLGNGDGTFQSPKYSPYDGGYQIAVADFTGDHKADLATSERLYSGSGDGYFHYTSLLPESGGGVLGMVLAGDFNKDGKPDLVVYDGYFQWTLLGNGQGNFTATAEYHIDGTYGYGPWFATDLNGDGKPDLVMQLANKVECYPDGSCDLPISILVEMGKGDGSFTTPSTGASFTDSLFGTTGLGDVNGDKKLDLVIAGQLVSSPQNQVHTYFGRGDGTFEPFVSSNINCNGLFAMGDLNGDGRSDLLCNLNGKVTFYSSSGNGSYTQGTVFTGSAGGIVIADLNKDGTRDAILLNATTGPPYSVTVLLNLSGTSMSASTTPSTLVYKQPFSLNASVTASITQTPHPTGSVTYKNGTTTLGSAGLGSAVSIPAGLTVGAHSLSAAYGGDNNFNPHIVTGTKTVGKASSSTKLATSSNPSTHGHAVTFTATVAPQFAGVPTGKITFKNGSAVLASVTMSSGKATYTTASLSVGTHSLTATYTGDGNFNGSASPVLSQKVN